MKISVPVFESGLFLKTGHSPILTSLLLTRDIRVFDLSFLCLKCEGTVSDSRSQSLGKTLVVVPSGWAGVRRKTLVGGLSQSEPKVGGSGVKKLVLLEVLVSVFDGGSTEHLDRGPDRPSP